MRLALAALGFLLALAMPAMAQTNDTPRGLLEAIYQSYSTDIFPDDDLAIYSNRLKALFAADRERTPEGEIGAIDFDPFVNAQDYDLTNLVIGEPTVTDGQASAQVRFVNLGEKNTLVITMVRESDGWKVDDVQSTEGEVQWKLSELLGDVPAITN